MPKIIVTAEVLPGKFDPSAEAHFANNSRAGQYAQLLADSRDYARVNLIDQDGTTWPISPKEDS
jgi:hypothetical protein